MDLKELYGLYSLDKEIETLKEELHNLRLKHYTLSSKEMDFIKGSGKYDIVRDKVAEIIEVENLIEQRMQESVAESKKILKYINTIKDAELRVIFVKRFLQKKSIEEIAKEMGYERTTISKKINRYINNSHNSH